MLKDLLNGYITQKDILIYYNANITCKKLPKGINGFIFGYMGLYNIIINKNLPQSKKKKTFIHEIAHLELNQLCQKDKDLFAFHIEEYEDEADRYIKLIMDSINNERLIN